ncbi:MAG: Lactoylglutathione lyase [Labilithrix sp.]|nr:Lactoylglutathione lyase [Labilithrix sp.]
MRIHHLAFRTSSLARLERFYVDALGLAVVKRHADRSVWLDAGGAIVMLELREEDEGDASPTSKDLVAFAVPPEDRARITERLAAAGIAVEASTEYTLYVRDPDGRRIGLSSYPVPLR